MFTQKQFTDWLLAQPDNRPIDMTDGSLKRNCTCVMSAFLKDNGFHDGMVMVWGSLFLNGVLYPLIKLEVHDIWSLFPESGKTCGELKQQLR